MFNHLENNWMSICYDDDLTKVRRTHPDQSFKVVIKQTTDPILDFRTECIKATRSIKDTYPNEKFSLMFSGGSESEMMVRAFKEAGLNFDVYIGKFNDNLNIYDVSYAVVACESLNIPYTIIDFDVKRFFENDALDYSLKSQVVIPLLLPQMALCDKVDGIPIMGGGELLLERVDKDYTKKGEWIVSDWEYNWCWTKYFSFIGRPAIVDWLRWTPNQFFSLFKTKWFDKITNDGYPGKLGISSTKIHGYREAWPELLIRQKKHGMEDIETWLIDVSAELYDAHKGETYGAKRLKKLTKNGYSLYSSLDECKKNSNYWKPEDLLKQAKG
jgi:hypothetical protein